jgi:hypothetical protein
MTNQEIRSSHVTRPGGPRLSAASFEDPQTGAKPAQPSARPPEPASHPSEFAA